MTRMTPEAAQAWIDELESGKYVQGKKRLQNKDGSMCCLAVLADMRGELNVRGEWELNGGICYEGIPYPTGSKPVGFQGVGITVDDESTLTVINDDSDTFAPVIQKIRELYIDN